MAEGFRSCEVDLFFGDGSYLFRLGLKQIVELEEKCDAGLGAIFARVLTGRVLLEGGQELGLSNHAAYRYSDLRETIRLGLIGGGTGEVNHDTVKVTASKALQLVERYVDGQPAEDAWKLAAAILTAACQGYTTERFKRALPGEEDDEEEEAEPGGPEGKPEEDEATDTITPSSSTTADSSESNPKPQDA